MTNQFSKSQIDRLGERLKKGKIEEDDLRMLDQYRRAYISAYEIVVKAIREQLLLEPTGRPAKSTTSVVEKLKRESIRLTQIQDIAGCRLIATDIANQNEVVDALGKLFDDVTIVDRREKPSHGYRAVHIVVKVQERLIEIQVRTILQHLWAENSEKLADLFGQEVKYGNGHEIARDFLKTASELVKNEEGSEIELVKVKALFTDVIDEELLARVADIEANSLSQRNQVHYILRDYIVHWENLKRQS